LKKKTKEGVDHHLNCKGFQQQTESEAHLKGFLRSVYIQKRMNESLGTRMREQRNKKRKGAHEPGC